MNSLGFFAILWGELSAINRYFSAKIVKMGGSLRTFVFTQKYEQLYFSQ